jgi:hypothetical protein
MKTIKIALAGLCLLALPALGQADDIEEQIQRGVKAYQDGQHREAIQELQFAISQLQELLNKEYLTLLPAPPAGWEAEDSEAQTMPAAILGGGTSISRSYRRGEERMEITMMADSPLLASLSMMLSNPAMLAAGGNVRPYRYESYRGIIEKQDNGAEISLLVANRVLVKLSGDNIEGEKTLEGFLKAMDFRKIEETLAP